MNVKAGAHTYLSEYCMLTVHGSHTLIKIPSHFTHCSSKKIIKIPLENPCTWMATLPKMKSVTKTFIFKGEKTTQAKRWQPVESLFLSASVVSKQLLRWSGYFLYSFCHGYQAAHSVTCMVSHAAAENCMKCGFSYETDCWRDYCEDSFWMNLDFLCRCRSLATNRMLHINHAWETHVNQDSFISNSFSKKMIKIPLQNNYTRVRT